MRMIARRGAIKKRIAYYGKRYRWCKGKMGREKSSKILNSKLGSWEIGSYFSKSKKRARKPPPSRVNLAPDEGITTLFLADGGGGSVAGEDTGILGESVEFFDDGGH